MWRLASWRANDHPRDLTVPNRKKSQKKPRAAKRRGIQSFDTGLRVLEVLANLNEPSALGTVAQACDLSASQAHRYLSSLLASGMALQDAQSGRYEIGPTLLKLGLAALARVDTFRIADAAISEFARRTGRTVQIAALGPLGPTIVRWNVGTPPVVTSLNVGSVLPMLHSATGRVFLAFAPEPQTRALVKRELAALSRAGSVDVEALKKQVRQAGCASVDGDVVPGLRATAFPVFDLQGRGVLTATVLANESFDRAADAAIHKELAAVCARITESLGGRPPSP
jgi:DNA-binding IclR family transcriptional regulator